MFDARVAFAAYPDVPGYAAYDTDIVSGEMPSGASWLANCLLELGVPLWKPWGADISADWETRSGGRFRYLGRDEGWRRLLPALSAGREFAFRAAPVPRLTHAWPGTYPAVARTLLFVRDPRDALLSLWHRARAVGPAAADESFVDVLRAPWFHYPVARGDFLRLWLRTWRLALAERDHLILRFEDYRRDAVATLQRAVEFLRIPATPGAIAAAAAASDFRVARAAEQDLLERGAVAHRLIRAGRSEEWRDTYDAAMHAAVGPEFQDLYTWLGYPHDCSAGIVRPVQKPSAEFIDRLLHAAQAPQMEPASAQALRGWFAQAAGDMRPIG